MTKKVKSCRSAYQFFCIAIIDVIRQIRQYSDEKRKRGEIFKEMSELWKQFKLQNTDPQVMSRIYREVEYDKNRYLKEIYEWQWTKTSKDELLKKFQKDDMIRRTIFIRDIDKLFEYESNIKQKTLDDWIQKINLKTR
jgi:hypothetical protein